jgi:hypothetical protein
MIPRACSRAAAAAAALCCVAFLTSVAPARADDPPFIGWSWLLPGIAWQYDPSSADDCIAGRFTCINKTLSTMRTQFDAAARVCDHDAVFALTYLRTTEEFRRAVETDGFFEDPYYLNHEDAVFAQLYFQAKANWDSGNNSAVPGAWATAFDAADQRAVSGQGNLLLGINAHVQLDLPFTLAAIGLVKPDGSSRKHDHDQVNVFLNRVVDPLLAELAKRFDPAVNARNLPGPYDEFTLFQLIVAWRELAWRNAERLVAATTQTDRNLIARSIRDHARDEAKTIRTSTAYLPLLQSSTQRDAYCAANG